VINHVCRGVFCGVCLDVVYRSTYRYLYMCVGCICVGMFFCMCVGAFW
jgi:hypothetical protein